jgi:hypothetical protein
MLFACSGSRRGFFIALRGVALDPLEWTPQLQKIKFSLHISSPHKQYGFKLYIMASQA